VRAPMAEALSLPRTPKPCGARARAVLRGRPEAGSAPRHEGPRGRTVVIHT
jgi:hypothetical protein